ncbi:MAG: GNAT family N-acetyltransferase [Actinomycetota bacterium]|nr:GNAT family N-acetyltransferase [Actinomycetota bacterium]
MTGSVEVRQFAESDWPEFLPILQEVARAGETYAIEPDVDGECARAFWSSAHLVAAAQDGLLLGSAKMGPNRPAQGAHVGTASFMVSAAARGQGVGRALAEYVVDWHRANGFRAIQFNAVVETNVAAVRLWQSLGFTIVGTVPEAFRCPDGSYVGLHVMHLSLVQAISRGGRRPR